jgi:acetyl esterase/lipase
MITKACKTPALSVLCLLALFLFSIYPDCQANEKEHRRLFNKWDINQNNRIELGELPGYARKNFNKVDQNNDQSISLIEHLTYLAKGKNKGNEKNFKILTDIPYANTNNPRQTLDLFLPEKRKKDQVLPLVIWIHGGGWKNGDKKSGHSPNRLPKIVQTGRYVGASIAYRLSGEETWPAQIHDCKAAVRWLRAHEKKYNIDPARIAVWGSSAGGHLVSMLGVTNGNKELEGTVGTHTLHSSKVQAVINYYGPSALLQMNDYPSRINHNAPDSPESQLLGFPIQEKKKLARQASPLSYVTKDDASFIHFHGTRDQLVPYPQSQILHQSMKEQSLPSILITLKSAGHDMPGEFTTKYILPFLEHKFYGRGNHPETQIIEKNR